MDPVLSILGLVVLAFWVGILLDRRRAWPTELQLRTNERDEGESGRDEPAGGSAPGGGLLVVIPARNEEAMVAECLPSLLAQSEDFDRLVLVDDRSEDGTGATARRLVEASLCADRARVARGEPTPDGWSGKLWALRRGLLRALAAPGGDDVEWILFTDADIRHPPGSIRALRRLAEREAHDLVSVMVRLRAVSFWERLLVPPFVYFFQLIYPFRRVASGARGSAAAAGGCLLVSRRMLEASGGLEAIRDAVIDDVSLARSVRRAGGRLWLGLCPDMVSARPYDGLGDIVRMVARTAFTQLGRSYLALALCIPGLLLVLVSPPVLALAAVGAGSPVALAASLGSWGIQAGTLLPVVRHHRVPGVYAATLPLASLVYAWATLLSGWNHARGLGARWKGRRIAEGGEEGGGGADSVSG